ncbi:hypothetical protein SLEP1_g52470 [Rubroshorea leprosula]|uniref:Uncharacterized protein n=1 Tax=Rubroshorea leprosula TaxID=152421 RepID=A0AAV5M6D9_9ROSI|nr:hypothetical protein SLEP1_g52470 [Rubroshorea leprosula]
MVHTRSVRAGNSSLPLGQSQPPNNIPPLIPPQLPPQPPPQVPAMFPPVDHAEGGDKNQPHNSAHNSASTANQDVVVAQLAAIQSHIAPVQQPLHDDVTRRLDSLEKLVAEQRGALPPHHAVDSIPHPLNTNITLEPYPAGFRIPQLEIYDETKYPDDHLHAFYSCMQAQNASDALMCKIFPSTLRGNARTWYYSLPLRFNDAILKVSSFNQAVGITTVISRLSHERFKDSLLKHPATTFSEVNDRSLKFITAEEYALLQKPAPSKNQHPEWRDDDLSRKRMRMVQNRGPMSTSTPRFRGPNSTPPQQSAGKPPVNWILFNLPRSLIFLQIKNKMDLRRLGPMKTVAASRDHTRYCDYHQDHGHTTKQCNSLKFELESLAQKGMLNEYVQRVEQPRFVREQRPQPQGVRNPPNRQGVGYQQAPPPLPPPARIIHMITGGLEASGLSSKQRKLYVKEVKHQNRAQKWKFDDADWKSQPVTFTSADFDTVVTPNNDPLVTSAMINNCEVQRVLVDIGSAPDIMYFHCFEGLGLNPALFGRTYVTPSVQFLVVKMASSFNVVIGRPTLTEIRAVISDNQQVMGVEIVDNRPEDETKAAPVEDVEEVHIDDRDPSRKTQIGTKLNSEEKAKLIAFLRANKDVFAWTSADMPGIPTSVSQHKLSTNPLKKPVAQKRHLFRGERLQLVEAASGNERLSLLDAYSGYHQVPMALEDADKISFYAGDEIYCYVMMPFGLKNAGANYQKMVTIVFRAQIGRNLEVYVDDIVVKSLKVGDHLIDLEETFNNLRKNKMRLNPAKCIFGVESGKFLGLMVSRRGIEVNPEKIKAVAEMEPPKSVKDVQRLTGRVAARHRFISKLADKCLPFFKIMRLAAQKDESGKQKKFAWNSECQAAFDELKSYLSLPPLLTKADDGEILYLYLGISNEAIKCTPGHSTPNPEPNDWTLYVDEASSSKGSGAGALLIGPDGYQSEHALKFNFDATNNMAEYEALLLGLQLALELKISAIQVYSDSQLVVNQTNSICEVVDPVMVKYVALVAELKCKFQKFCLSKSPRTENEQADSLSKFTSDSSSSSRSVFVEVLDEPSFVKPRIMEISTNPDTPCWTDSIISFLRDGIVPADRQEAMKLRKKASRHTLVNGVLYKRSLSLPLLRCLNPYEAECALREVHEGVYGSHVGARTLAHKVLRQGYYWPNMYKDATHFVQRYPKCQFFLHLTHQPAEELTNLVAPWPFAQWGLDLLGPFVKGVGGVTHLIVGMDYFTKWVEARPLSSLTSKKVEDFVFSSIIYRYGIPNQIVFTSVYHPESNGMVESINKCILEGIKSRLEQHKAKWADEHNNVLWAYRTTSLTAIGETSYHLAFGTEAVIPVEIGVPSFRVTHFDEGRNGQLLRENLDLLAEVREEARLRTLVYKQKLANFYNKRVRPRTFKV